MKNRKSPVPPQGTSREAKKTAGVVLEVLAGTLAPSGAASTLGISISRYYMIESKALEGLVKACEIGGKKDSGKRPEKRIEELEKDKARLERETARYQALVRASQRTVGLAVKKPKDTKDKRGRRRRKPAARALRFAGKLKEEMEKGEKEDEQRKTAGGAEPGRGIGRLGAGKEETAGNSGDGSGK